MGNTTDSIIAAPLTSARQTVPPAFTNSAAWILPPSMLAARPVVKTATVNTATGPAATRQCPSWLKSATVPQILAAAVAVIVAADLGFLMRRPNMSLASAAIMPVSIVAPPLAEPDPHRITTTTTTQPPALTASRPAPQPTHVSTDGMGMWSCIINHESGGNPHAVNRSSGAGGLFQFLPASWRAYGGSGEPQNASVQEQWRVARNAYARSGFAPWRGDGCV